MPNMVALRQQRA